MEHFFFKMIEMRLVLLAHLAGLREVLSFGWVVQYRATGELDRTRCIPPVTRGRTGSRPLIATEASRCGQLETIA